jgi:FkbM family methyltransferase
MTLLDIGANIGIYSIVASEMIGKKGNIYAFEPVLENFKMLEHNLSINNGSSPRVVVFPENWTGSYVKEAESK